MKKLSKILCLCSVLILISCDYVTPSTWNYRITVEIETPEGIKTGSAVRQVSVYKNIAKLINPDVSSLSINVKGEAVVVDLGERGVVFSLINWSSYEELFSAFPLPSRQELVPYYSKFLKPGMKTELKTNHPKMVTFTDMDDPKSVKLVKGGRFNAKTQKHDPVNDFEKFFGKGVHLKRIMIEITDDPVTWNISKYLIWLYGLNGHYLHGGMTSRQAPLGLHAGNFKIGEK